MRLRNLCVARRREGEGFQPCLLRSPASLPFPPEGGSGGHQVQRGVDAPAVSFPSVLSLAPVQPPQPKGTGPERWRVVFGAAAPGPNGLGPAPSPSPSSDCKKSGAPLLRQMLRGRNSQHAAAFALIASKRLKSSKCVWRKRALC